MPINTSADYFDTGRRRHVGQIGTFELNGRYVYNKKARPGLDSVGTSSFVDPGGFHPKVVDSMTATIPGSGLVITTAVQYTLTAITDIHGATIGYTLTVTWGFTTSEPGTPFYACGHTTYSGYLPDSVTAPFLAIGSSRDYSSDWQAVAFSISGTYTIDADCGTLVNVVGYIELVPPGGAYGWTVTIDSDITPPHVWTGGATSSTWQDPSGIIESAYGLTVGLNGLSSNAILLCTGYTTSVVSGFPTNVWHTSALPLAGGASGTMSAGYSTGSGAGLSAPTAFAAFSCPAGTATNNSLSIVAPALLHLNIGATSLNGIPRQNIAVHVADYAIGGPDTSGQGPTSIEIWMTPLDTGAAPFVRSIGGTPGVAATYSETFVAFGYARRDRFTTDTANYSNDVDEYQREPNGHPIGQARSQFVGPMVTVAGQGIVSPNGPVYLVRLPIRSSGSTGTKGGGLALTPSSTATIAADPWTIGGTGWTSISGVTFATTGGGTSGNLLITVPSGGGYAGSQGPVTGPYGPAAFGWPMHGHRYIHMRIRSTAAANLRGNLFVGAWNIAFATDATKNGKPFVTGAAGAWVDVIYDTAFDLRRAEPIGANPVNWYIRGRAQAVEPWPLLTGLDPGVYEIEYIRSEFHTEARASMIDGGSFASVYEHTSVPNVGIIQGTMDGLVTLSMDAPLGGTNSNAHRLTRWNILDDILSAINTGSPMQGWTAAAAQPKRGGKPTVQPRYLLLSDLYDEECSSQWLGAGNVFHDGSCPVDLPASGGVITIPCQWAGSSCAVYPGCGDPFTADGSLNTAYSNTTTLPFARYSRGQLVALLSGGNGRVVCTLESDGSAAGSGSSLMPAGSIPGSVQTGLTPVAPPGNPLNTSLRVATVPVGVPVDPPPAPGTDVTSTTLVLFDHADNVYVPSPAHISGWEWPGRHYVLFVTPGPSQPNGPDNLATEHGGYYCEAWSLHGAIQFRRTAGQQLPRTSADYLATVDVTVPPTGNADEEPSLLFNYARHRLEITFTRISDPVNYVGAVWRTTSSDDGATWDAPVQISP